MLSGWTAEGAERSFRKSGYIFQYVPGPADASGRITSYTISARPVTYRKTGTRSFLLDETGKIRATPEHRAATARDEVIRTIPPEPIAPAAPPAPAAACNSSVK